ncbi:hypothetical protein [Erythrobacter sp. MTPC3]|uniref:hypothetical protein n=1 Tax=Erythrobacter sp. MTPC3 TaxID=3056564 RepID=UPI0036F29073
MIGAALLLSMQAAPAAEPISEIVVLGNLRSVQVSVGQDREGRWHCSMNKSTGRLSLDKSFCKAVTKCVRKGADDQEKVESCISDTRSGLLRKVEREMKKN